MRTKKELILIRMASDIRIPRSAMGYIDDLYSPCISKIVKKDRLLQLAKYTPELVEQIERLSE